MGRKRLYSDSAERQRAHRARLRDSLNSPVLPPIRQPRKRSRPARLAAVEDEIRCLLDEYQDWLDRLPDSLQESGQAQNLADTIESLSSAADLLAELTPPRGFGKD
jgi:hypothetical protein